MDREQPSASIQVEKSTGSVRKIFCPKGRYIDTTWIIKAPMTPQIRIGLRNIDMEKADLVSDRQLAI
jgi:hypothetical protein